MRCLLFSPTRHALFIFKEKLRVGSREAEVESRRPRKLRLRMGDSTVL